jgi:hypothetical protein
MRLISLVRAKLYKTANKKNQIIFFSLRSFYQNLITTKIILFLFNNILGYWSFIKIGIAGLNQPFGLGMLNMIF